MNTLDEWARQYGVGAAALADLRRRIVGQSSPAPAPAGQSESRISSLVRLEASRKGLVLWRNNVGALMDSRGVPVRYGLANDSKALNETIKSADLIGIRPVTVTPAMVGSTIGQFVSRETKRGGWRYVGDAHEQAQLRWAELVLSMGGDAAFAAGEGTL